MPTQFTLKKEGIFACRMTGGRDKEGEVTHVFVCGPLRVIANVRDMQNGVHYRVIRITTMRGEQIEVLIADRLIGERELVSILRDMGLKIGTDLWCSDKVREYINESCLMRSCRLVKKIGWQGPGEYALQDQIFGMPQYGDYEPAYMAPNCQHPFNHNGGLTLWRAEVGRPCSGNSRLILAVCAGLAGPLLKPSGENYIGLHFIGGSSLGKSTALIVGGSACGGSGGPNGFVKQWRATSNALEGVAEQHNDSLLALDEIRQASGRDISEVIYMLGNSQGKSRMNPDSSIRQTRTFRVVLLSSGEESLETRMNAEGNERKRGGQDVRFIEIPADAGAGLGLFQELHGCLNGESFSRKLQGAATQYYGDPLRAFLHQLTNGQSTRDIGLLVDRCHKRLLDAVPASNEEVGRVARKFAVLAVAGELATEWNITGWQMGEAEWAIREVFDLWRDQRGKRSGDTEQAMRQVREFFKRFLHSRFDWPERNAQDSVGFVIGNGSSGGDNFTCICVDPDLFKGIVCKGYDASAALKAFLAEGSLEPSREAGRYTVKKPLPRSNQRKNVYAFLPSVLEGCRDW